MEIFMQQSESGCTLCRYACENFEQLNSCLGERDQGSINKMSIHFLLQTLPEAQVMQELGILFFAVVVGLDPDDSKNQLIENSGVLSWKHQCVGALWRTNQPIWIPGAIVSGQQSESLWRRDVSPKKEPQSGRKDNYLANFTRKKKYCNLWDKTLTRFWKWSMDHSYAAGGRRQQPTRANPLQFQACGSAFLPESGQVQMEIGKGQYCRVRFCRID